MDITVPCPCPGAPHPDGDIVTLREKPTFHMGTTALAWAGQSATNERPSAAEIMEVYLRDGIIDWTFIDKEGALLPLDADGLDWLLDDYELAMPIANAAADLYTERIFAPLLKGTRNSSRTGPTGRSTSRRSRRTRSTPSPSEPSSTESSEAS